MQLEPMMQARAGNAFGSEFRYLSLTNPGSYDVVQLEQRCQRIDIAVLGSLQPGVDYFRRRILNVIGRSLT